MAYVPTTTEGKVTLSTSDYFNNKYIASQERLFIIQEGIGRMIEPMLKDYYGTEISQYEVIEKYSLIVEGIIESNAEYIIDIHNLYQWMGMSYEWMLKYPYAAITDIIFYMEEYCFANEGKNIVSKILRDINNGVYLNDSNDYDYSGSEL